MKFTRLSLLGEGGLAQVWSAKDEEGRLWALKQLKPSVTDPKMVARFRNEIRIQASLAHPNILAVVAANVSAPNPFYVMPVAGSNLEQEIPVIASNPSGFVKTAKEMIDALTHAHGQGVYHRDLKARNVLRLGDKVCIADFGLGKAINIEASYTTTTSDQWGTYWYAPPEQSRGLRHCDHRSDIYSLGKLILHCLAGSRVGEIPPSLDSRWRYVIRGCIRDNPDERWQSMSQLKQQFDAVFGIDQPMVVDPEGLLQLISQIAVAGDGTTGPMLDKFLSAVAGVGEDEVLLRQVFDRLPENLVRAWAEKDGEGLFEFVNRYNDSLPTYIDFAYCDTIANQMAIIYKATNSPDLRELVRRRLFSLGPSHNRWHVGGVLAEIVATVRDAAEIVQVINLIGTDPQAAEWNARYLKDKATIDKRIRDALPAS